MSENQQPLTEKQLAFCREYIIDFNGARAATRAGYAERSASTAAARLLVNDKVQSKVRELIEARAERTGITADRVVQQLAKIAFFDVKQIAEWGSVREPVKGKNGQQLKDGNGNPRFVDVDYIRPKSSEGIDGTLVQGVKMTKYGLQVDIPDKMRAFEMLARHLGVYDDTPQTTVNIAPYADALKKAAGAGEIWEGFNNGGPGGGSDGEG